MSRRTCVRVLADEVDFSRYHCGLYYATESCYRQVQIFPFHGHAPFQATPPEKHIILTNKRHQRLLWPHSPETHELDILSPVKQLLKHLCNSVTKLSAQSIGTLYTNILLIIIIIINCQ